LARGIPTSKEIMLLISLFRKSLVTREREKLTN
jgi:hypothetical protein